MKLIWLTDIHLNFVKDDDINHFFTSINSHNPDYLVISGDIADGRSFSMMLDKIESSFKIPICFVLGNHDYYHQSFAYINKLVENFCNSSNNLVWLDRHDPIQLDENSVLIGHSGWADGLFGNYDLSSVMINDYLLIEDFKGLSKTERLYIMKNKGSEAAEHISRQLAKINPSTDHIFCVTHVPPFKESCWHEGKISDDFWLPHFSCKQVGDIILEYMKSNKHRKMTVLCGHTHSEGIVAIRDNLIVKTGKAIYKQPEIQQIITL